MTRAASPLVLPDAEALRSSDWRWALVALTVLAALLRFWHLGTWSFDGDEGFTIAHTREAIDWLGHRPLAFAMNKYIAVPLFGFNEFSLRLFPALAGIAAVPVFAWLVARVYGVPAGLFTGLAIAVSPWLLYHSQFARYYMQSFLVAGIIPFAVRFWMAGLGNKWLVVAAACTALGWYFVPTSVFILPGVALWMLWNARELRDSPVGAWVQRHLKILLALALVTVAVGAVLFVRLYLESRAVLTNDGRYFTLFGTVLSTVNGLTITMTAMAMVGAVAAWQTPHVRRIDRTFLPLVALGALCVYPAIFPIAVVGSFHVVSVLAAVFGLMGIGFAAIWNRLSDKRMGAAVVVVIFASTLRPLASYHVDGGRADIRAAAARVDSLSAADPGPIYAVGHGLFLDYAPEMNVQEYLQGPDDNLFPWTGSQSGPVWLVLVERRKGIVVAGGAPISPDRFAFCDLVWRHGRDRYDYYVNAMRIYRCPSNAADSQDSADSTLSPTS